LRTRSVLATTGWRELPQVGSPASQKVPVENLASGQHDEEERNDNEDR
jgi:hypothetical protein